MIRRLPSLNALRAFEAAARNASFKLAASELNVSHAAISRHIRELEGWLATPLFRRTGRGVELTEDGTRLGHDITPAFDLLCDAMAAFAPQRGQQRLIVTAELSFAALWLVPRLGRFTAMHPNIDIVVDANDRLADLNKHEADLGIRYGKGSWRDVEAVKLFDADNTVVCNPALLRKWRAMTWRDLAGETLIRDDTKDTWPTWLAAAGVPDGAISPSGPTLKGNLVIVAAEAGQGFALADMLQAADALLEGRLVRPFDIVARHHAYWLVRAENARETAAARDFRLWLRGEIEKTRKAVSRVWSSV